MRSALKDILYAKTVEQADRLIVAFKTTWEQTASGLIQYLEKNYLDHMADRRRWMFCYRGVSYAWINTNNYIESWHNALKKHFFKNKQQRRIDSVIYILVYKAISHYQQMCIRHHVQVGKMTPAAKKQLKVKIAATNHLDQERAKDPNILLLYQPSDSTLLRVRSFSYPSIHYDIKIDWNKGAAGVLDRCSCADFTSNKMCCKHIALVLI